MRILVLGGTWYVGRAIVEAALRDGHNVTTFNRGKSGDDVPGVNTIRGDRGNPDDLERLVAEGPWDAVFDTSGYVPRDVLKVSRMLEPVAAHYVIMSTVSVYQGWPNEPLSETSPVLYCPPDAGPDYGDDTEDGPTQYGYQKAGCESAVNQVFGPERSTNIRPGVVLGPREYVGRLPWWLNRAARGGRILAPGEPSRQIQPIDVRDLAEFAVHVASKRLAGDFNVTAPRDHSTFEDFLQDCVAVTEPAAAELVWVSDEALLAGGVRQWSEMPLWRISRGVWAVDSRKAQSAGLSYRPLQETVADTWLWMRSSQAVGHERSSEIGIAAFKESAILRGLS